MGPVLSFNGAPLATTRVGAQELLLGRVHEGSATVGAGPRRLAAPRVQRLFAFRRPSAVVFRVARAVIHAIDGVCYRWTLAHICKEQFEVKPSLAEGNTPASVVLIGVIGGVQAATFHGVPDAVFSRPNSTMLQGLLSAAAAFYARVTKRGDGGDEVLTAVTKALVGILAPRRMDRRHPQHPNTSNRVAAQIGVCWHSSIVNQGCS